MADLKDRTREFSLRVIRLFAALPKTAVPKVIGQQMLRSGTSVGAHFREGIRSRSAAEYVSKINGALMELEETVYWIELLEHSGVVRKSRLIDLEDEASQLSAIFVSLIKKAKKS
jgi:four helix bundle protein